MIVLLPAPCTWSCRAPMAVAQAWHPWVSVHVHSFDLSGLLIWRLWTTSLSILNGRLNLPNTDSCLDPGLHLILSPSEHLIYFWSLNCCSAPVGILEIQSPSNFSAHRGRSNFRWLLRWGLSQGDAGSVFWSAWGGGQVQISVVMCLRGTHAACTHTLMAQLFFF